MKPIRGLICDRLPDHALAASRFTAAAQPGALTAVLNLDGTGRRLLYATCLLLMFLFTANTALAKGEACPAYEQLGPLLNSERIQSCFGSYGVEVLFQEGNLRVSSLYSMDGDQRITRTLAISEFASDLPASLETAYQSIRAGSSMGATLEAGGWRVDKRQRYLGEVPLSAAFGCMSGLADSTGQTVLAVQVYDLYVIRKDEAVRFALLAELHDPRYLTLPDLQQIYVSSAEQLQQPDQASEQMLQRLTEVCVRL